MQTDLALWSSILLCFAMAGAFGGGLYEHIVLTPLWSASPPSSFAIIQRGTGVPLQRFWIPVHVAITIFILSTLFLTWNDMTVRRLLLAGLASYIIMRVWSGLFFIREMLAFQKIPPDSAPSPELSAQVARWTYWTWFREPLDMISLLSPSWLRRGGREGTRVFSAYELLDGTRIWIITEANRSATTILLPEEY
jgi:hypothetical protein